MSRKLILLTLATIVVAGLISTVAGENGTAVLGDPRVARAAQELTLMSFETW